MHDSIQRRLVPPQAPRLRFCFGSTVPLTLALLASTLLAAQTPAQTPNRTPKRSGQSHPPAPLPAQVTPPAPPKPDWPIDDQPKPAAILWNKDELRIDAANSSLQQIMNDVASATGASIDGLSKDERVFGAYGPAPARDVLAQLLQGTGYNIVMVGDQGQGSPRQIILSARNAGGVAQNINRPTPEENDEDTAPEPQYEPPPQTEQLQRPNVPPQSMRPGFIPGAPGTYLNPQQPGQQQPVQQPVQPVQQPNQQNP